MNLPKVTQDYLDYGAANGNRNNSLLDAACQIRDSGASQDTAETILIPRAMEDGLTRSEAVRTIRSAYNRDARDPISHGNGHGRKYEPRQRYEQKVADVDPIIDAPPKQLPAPMPNGMETFLSACFKPGEFVSIGCAVESEDGRMLPDSGITMPVDNWIKKLKKIKDYNGNKGVYVRVNPMQQDGDSDHQVAKYRHCLLEFDSIPKDQQYGAILESGLPISAILDSAGKSVHAWIRVDAKDRREFDARVATVYALFSNYSPDPRNKNPSRYSRLPDMRRGDGLQRLLAVNVGAASWDDWAIENEKDGYPDIETIESLLVRDIPEPPVVIDGMLHKGGKMVLGATSKGRKTWVMLDLALSIANGHNWMGVFKCQEGKVLYLNFELMEFTLKQRVSWIIEKKTGSIGKNIEFWNLKGHACDMEVLADKIIRRVNKRRYQMIIVDPVYKSLGWRKENDAGDMNDMLNHLERIVVATEASVAFSAHFPKGDMGARQSMDRISGSGVFSRDPEAVLTMSEHDDNKKNPETERFVIQSDLRNFAKCKDFTVLWQAPLMIKDTTPPKVAGTPGAKQKFRFEDMLKYRIEGMTVNDWFEKCHEETSISKATFYKLKTKHDSQAVS